MPNRQDLEKALSREGWPDFVGSTTCWVCMPILKSRAGATRVPCNLAVRPGGSLALFTLPVAAALGVS